MFSTVLGGEPKRPRGLPDVENPDEVTPAYDGGAEFVVTHEPPDPPDPEVTFLTGDVGEAFATAAHAGEARTSRSSVPNRRRAG